MLSPSFSLVFVFLLPGHFLFLGDPDLNLRSLGLWFNGLDHRLITDSIRKNERQIFVLSEGLQFLNYDEISILDFNCIIHFIIVVIIFGNG